MDTVSVYSNVAGGHPSAMEGSITSHLLLHQGPEVTEATAATLEVTEATAAMVEVSSVEEVLELSSRRWRR